MCLNAPIVALGYISLANFCQSRAYYSHHQYNDIINQAPSGMPVCHSYITREENKINVTYISQL